MTSRPLLHPASGASQDRAAISKPGGARRDGARCGILVLGMHRSGTSAITRVLNLLGVELGARLMPAQAGVNDTGFWEHVDVVALHERLLQWHSSNWSDIRPLPAMDLARGVGAEAMDEARALIRRDFAETRLWAIKDPRMSLFAPLWLQAMADEGVDTKVIIAVRHPREVADSLQRRDGLTRGHAFVLWGQYVAEALRASRGRPRAVSDYAALLRDWRPQVETLAERLHIDWPMSVEAAGPSISAFLDADRRHHRAVENDAPGDPLEQSVLQMYGRLVGIADGHDEWQPLDDAVAEFERVNNTFGPHLSDLLAQVWLHARRAKTAEDVITNNQLGTSAALAAQVDVLRGELAERDARLLAFGRAEGEGTTSTAARAELEGLLDTLRVAHESLGQNLQEDRDARIRSLNDIIAEKEARLHAAAESKRHLELWLAELQTHASNLETRRSQLEGELGESLAHAAALKAQLTERDGRLEDLRRALDKSLMEASDLALERSAFEARCDGLRDDIAERDARLNALALDLAEREDALQALASNLADRDAGIAALRSNLGELDSKIEALVSDLAERDRSLHELGRDLAERNSQIQSLVLELSARETLLLGKTRQIDDLEMRVQQITQSMAQQSEQLQGSRAHAEALETQMRRITGSRSWRYTAMFRRVSK